MVQNYSPAYRHRLALEYGIHYHFRLLRYLVSYHLLKSGVDLVFVFIDFNAELGPSHLLKRSLPVFGFTEDSETAYTLLLRDLLLELGHCFALWQ